MQRYGRNRLAIGLLAIGLLAAMGNVAWPQASRTIKLILPFPPGGPADTMARVLAEQVGIAGGPAMVVESHPGAATEIGTEYVSRSAPDGATLGIISNSFVVLPHFRKLNYEPLADFVPVCELASFPPLIVVNSASPYRTLADVIDAARQQPGKLTLATLGPATASQLAFEALKRNANVDITFVPFNGYTPAIQALLGNQVTAALADLSTLQGQLQTGKLRALATTARQRITLLPDVPTAAELGYKESEAEFFGGVVAPAKTPEATIQQLIKWFAAAMKVSDVKSRFAALGFYPGGACGADFAAILHTEYDKYGRIVREAHLNTN
jgi:tripartite-type tricarboxylate transporter receptor subunit TctC